MGGGGGEGGLGVEKGERGCVLVPHEPVEQGQLELIVQVGPPSPDRSKGTDLSVCDSLVRLVWGRGRGRGRGRGWGRVGTGDTKKSL